jgi:lipopolysaccharide transport system ATP-binding protein
MPDVTIRVRGLGKRFRRGAQKQGRLIEWLRRQKAYERFWALRDVTFDVKQGEMLGVIGLNGAGKSTLLRIISRITRPTEGRVEVSGRVGSLLDVGTGFHPELTGRENVFLNGTVLGIPKKVIKAEFERIVDFAEVEDFIDTPLKYYSSGMRIRLGMSVALNLPHGIMLVDEVLSVGDASFREKCLDSITAVTRSGRTVVFVGHNMEMISSTCDRSIWLEKGHLRAEGPAPEIVQEYQEQAIQKSRMRKGVLSLEGRASHGSEDGLWFTHVRLLDADGGSVPAFRTGQSVRIALGYELDHRSRPRDVSVAITVFGHSRVAVAHCENSVTGGVFERLPPVGEFVCQIDDLPLMPGRYGLGLKCRTGETVIHSVPHAGSFVVLEGDYYGTGVLPAPGSGTTLLDYRWSLEEMERPSSPASS